MALLTSNISTGAAHHHHHFLPRCPSLSQALPYLSFRRNPHLPRARRGLSSRTRRLEDRNRKGGVAAPEKEEDLVPESEPELESGLLAGEAEVGQILGEDGTVMPKLPGEGPDFWEGPQWNVLGFIVQYLWAFSLPFAVIACIIAAVTYNDGATDFKQTSVYKDSVQSQEVLEEPEASNTDVFEANPTEEAPSLE